MCCNWYFQVKKAYYLVFTLLNYDNISMLLFGISPQDLEAYMNDIHLESHPSTIPRDIQHFLHLNTGALGTWTIFIVLVL